MIFDKTEEKEQQTQPIPHCGRSPGGKQHVIVNFTQEAPTGRKLRKREYDNFHDNVMCSSEK